MQLNNNDLFLLSQCAISAAYQAGQIISSFVDTQISVEYKIGGTSLASQVVTKVDSMSQNIILQTILPSCKIYDLALLTEESHDDFSRLHKDFFWCIDPLDGTLPFVEKKFGYAVSIALVSNTGIPYIGVVYDPIKKTLYHAIKNKGAFRNGKQLKSESTSKLSNKTLTLITDRSFTKHNAFNDCVSKLKNATATTACNDLRIIQHGGAAMNACWVLENMPACYFKFPKPQIGGGSLWDYAATACIFNEAQAIATDIFGNSLELNRQDTTFLNHRGILYASNINLANLIMSIYKENLVQ